MRLLLAVLFLLALAGACSAGIITSVDVPVTIPDNGPQVQSTITVTNGIIIGDINVIIGELRHSWDQDLYISLMSPAGTIVNLFNRRGWYHDDLIDTLFDDEAADTIGSGSAPFTGSFRPESPLSAFDGENSAGTWTLLIQDMELSDTGVLNAWSLEVDEASATPEPATAVLCGLALALVAVLVRRKFAPAATRG